MKKLFPAIISLLMCVSASAQNTTPPGDCVFLKDLHYKNGIDTLVIAANNQKLFQIIPSAQIQELDKKKVLKRKYYNSAISFKPIDCLNEFNAECRFNSVKHFKEISMLPPDHVIYLTCVVFEGYKRNNLPFFVVEKVSNGKP